MLFAWFHVGLKQRVYPFLGQEQLSPATPLSPATLEAAGIPAGKRQRTALALGHLEHLMGPVACVCVSQDGWGKSQWKAGDVHVFQHVMKSCTLSVLHVCT